MAAILTFFATTAEAQRVYDTQTVPSGCGCFSGDPLNGIWTVYDYSDSPTSLGALPNSPHVPPLAANTITIGSQFDDYIRGTDIGEIICGGRGNDTIEGRGGNDTLSGGPEEDMISSSFLSTSPDRFAT